MQSIRIYRARPLAHEPHLGHNRFHPDIAPIVEVGEGEEVGWRRATRSTARSSQGPQWRIFRRSMPARYTR